MSFLIALLGLLLPGFSPSGVADDPKPALVKHTKANYELASQWTRQKVGKLVFDTNVTARWLESGDRFWYTFETTKGRKFWLVDPVKKSKAPVFDPVKLAAQLTTATGLPYDSQHLPITTIRFVKHDAAIQFEIVVPRDAVIPGEKKPDVAAPPVTGASSDGNDAAEPDDDDADDPQQQQQGPPRGPVAGRNEKLLSFEYDLAAAKLTLLDERPARKPTWANMSPDGKWVVFARKMNLYMMDAANYAKALKKADDPSIAEIQITKDGEEDFAYGIDRQQLQQQQEQQQQQQQENGGVADTAGQTQDNRNARVSPGNMSWSRDSSKFALTRRDSRKVEKLWVINSLANPRPTLETYRYAMPGDVNIPQPQIEVFDVASKERKIVKAELWKDQGLQIEVERPTERARDIQEKTEAVWAGPASDKLYFTRISRDLHRVDLCLLDIASGTVKPLIEERMNVYIETKPVRVINDGKELVWWSERDGWAQYYLFDAADGKLKNQITNGEFVAEDISYIDQKSRVMYLTASGHETGEDPYFIHFYSAKLEGGGMKLLDPGDASHAAQMSDTGKFFIDNGSRIDTAPVATLYDASGASLMTLETVDVAPLMQAGYHYPEAFTVKADDGITDLYGVMYRPFDFDAKKKYPMVEVVYPGPQTEAVNKTFTPRSPNMTLANLGFIVIEIGNRGGNPHRSKWYHTYGYGNLRDYGLADKKRAAEQLADRYPFIDIDRVGITGHSGGGFMSTAAMLVYPDFFKVAVSESGNHENNVYNNTWSEKHHGLKEVTDKEGKVTFDYSVDKNSELAKNLKGHLMLSSGDIDNNVHPANTMRLIDALIKAHKRFDFVVLPGQRHAYGAAADYFAWVRMDYFCKYLLGDFDQNVDMWELNRETPQVPPPSARQAATGAAQTGVQQQGARRRGGN